jgi:hypothetical protein
MYGEKGRRSGGDWGRGGRGEGAFGPEARDRPPEAPTPRTGGLSTHRARGWCSKGNFGQWTQQEQVKLQLYRNT